MIDRLVAIQRAHGWTDARMATELGVSQGMWTMVRRKGSVPGGKGRTPGVKVLAGVARRFPELREEVSLFLRSAITTGNDASHDTAAP